MENRLLVVLGAVLFAAGCGGSGAGAAVDSGVYWRSDSPALKAGWHATMPAYDASHLDEAAVVRALGLDVSTRSVIDADLNRVSYTTGAGTVSVFYDDGAERPFHTLNYLRTAPFEAETWSSSSELQRKWAEGAKLAAEYLKKLTELTPVIQVGKGTDAELSAALSKGYYFTLAVDGWPVWLDDMKVRVDAQGIYEFATDELPSAAHANGTIDCFTQAEVEKALASGGFKSLDPALPPPIFYGFDTAADKLTPFLLAASVVDSIVGAIPLDRAATN